MGRRFDYIPIGAYRVDMRLHELQKTLKLNPAKSPRFILPDGGHIAVHAHVTEVGHVVRNFIDCGGNIGKEEKVLLQTHVGDDIEHRLKSDRLSNILQLGLRVLPTTELDVDVEYDCCVVAQYPILEVKPKGEYLDIILQRGRTQCRARERREAALDEGCCGSTAACC